MSPPSPSKPPPHKPLSATTSAKPKKVRFEEREMMAANALIALSTADTMNLNKTSTPATNADFGNKSTTPEPSKPTDNKADDTVKPPEQGPRKFVLKLGSRKTAEEKQSEDSVRTENNSPGNPRESMAANAVVGLATSDIVDFDKADLESRYIASMLRKGDIKISDDALKVLEQVVEEFVLDQLKKMNATPRIEGPKQPVKLESPWARLPPLDEQTSDSQEPEVNAEIDTQGPAADDLRQRPTTKKLDQTKNPAISSATTSTSDKNMTRTTFAGSATTGSTDSNKASAPAAKTGFKSETVGAEHSKHIDVADNAVEIPEGGIYLRIIGPLEEDEEHQSKDSIKVQKWVVEGNGHRLDRGYKQERSDRIRAMIKQRERDKAERLARGEVGEAPLAPYTAQEPTISLLEFTFGPTADVEKPVGAGGDRANVTEKPEKPKPLVVMPPHQSSPGAMRPLVQDKSWQDRFNGLIGRTAREAIYNTKLKTPPADNQHVTAKKLDQTATWVTSTATNDEILASALSNIDISKAEKPSVSLPKPQNQPPSNLKPSPPNPFYRSDMTLAIAAQNTVAYFREAADWLNF